MLTILITCNKEVIDDSSNQGGDSDTIATSLEKIVDINANKNFVDANGNEVYFWGLNYTNPVEIDLIEDNWDRETTWDIIDDDFQEMKSYGANVIRIHLQYNRFMVNVNTPSQASLDKLKRLVKIAEKHDLYLLVTGLAAYRKSDQPEWYDALSNQERWEAHSQFWKTVAKTIGDSPAVFGYDLMNEPVNGVECSDTMPRSECEWLPGDDFGSYHFVQNIALQPDSTETIEAWTAKLASAIRSVDNQTYITTGFLPLGNVRNISTGLDFVSTHIYPKSEDIQKDIDYTLSLTGDTPFLVTESLNLHCTKEELQIYFNAVKDDINGFMGHYSGETIEDMAGSNDIAHALRTDFLNFFMENNPNK